MKIPDWYREAVAKHGAEVLAGTETRAEAVGAVIAAINGHPEFLDDLAGKDVDKWVKEHESSGDLFQAGLFPEIPVTMRVTPSKSLKVALMTGADLDNAKRMLYARTQNAIDGAKESAEHERAVFLAFYDKVRPLLSDDMTVKDAITRLAAQKAA